MFAKIKTSLYNKMYVII